MNAKAIVLKASLDEGLPGPEDFEIVHSVVQESELQDGGILVQLLTLSADPYMRGSIKSNGFNKGGNILVGFVSGKVIASKNPEWVVGDLFGARLPFKTVQIVVAAQLAQTTIWKLTGKIDESQISYGIGVLGMPGSTAYGGLLDVLRPKRNETIFISAASGAVGSLVGQLAKYLFNCKVIGSCGSEEKCALVREQFGFDAAINYKKANNAAELIALIKEHAPEGIDMYFENVGGMHFEAAMELLRPHGRVAICGQISEYNSKEAEKCFFNPLKMIYTNQRIEGFVCTPWLSGATGNFHADMADWLKDGVVKVQETITEGVENWPTAFQSLFTGANTGKVVVKV